MPERKNYEFRISTSFTMSGIVETDGAYQRFLEYCDQASTMAREGSRARASDIVATWTQAIKQIDDRLGELNAFQALNLAIAYVERGRRMRDALDYLVTDVVADFSQAVKLYERFLPSLSEPSRSQCRQRLGMAYAERGIAKEHAPLHGPGKAIHDFDLAIEQLEAVRLDMGAGWPFDFQNSTIGTIVNRGNAKQVAPGYGATAAIKDYDQAIVYGEALMTAQGAGRQSDARTFLANAYANRGNAKQNLSDHKPGTELPDFDRAIVLREGLPDRPNWSDDWRQSLAGGYVNRGSAKLDAPSHGALAAIDDLLNAIHQYEALRNKLDKDWPLPWQEHLGGAYLNLGVAMSRASSHGPRPAIDMFTKAITLLQDVRNKLGPACPPEWQNRLAIAYYNRGSDRCKFGREEKLLAEQDFRSAVELVQLLVSGKAAFMPAFGLGISIAFNLSYLLRQLGQLPEATDAADFGLTSARFAEQIDVRQYRPLRERLFEHALGLYRDAGQPHFLPELIDDELNPSRAGSAAGSRAMHQAAAAALGAALAAAASPAHATVQVKDLPQRLGTAFRDLAAIQARRFAGSASLARMRAAAEQAAGRTASAEEIMDRQVMFRPLDTEGFQTRADFRFALGRREEAEVDLVHAAKLVVAALPEPGWAGAEALSGLCDMMFSHRLRDLIADPAFKDPSRGVATRQAFDTMHEWLLRGLPRRLLGYPFPPAWATSLDRPLELLWERAFALREEILATQEQRWQTDLATRLAERYAQAMSRTRDLMLGFVPQPWDDFVRHVMGGAEDVVISAAEASDVEWARIMDEELPFLLNEATDRLGIAKMEPELAEIDTVLGADATALTERERKYLACAFRCSRLPGVEKFAVLELGCAVEWSLLDRAVHPLRAALRDGTHILARTEAPDRLHALLTGPDTKIELFPLIQAFTGAVALLDTVELPTNASGAFAAWLRNQGNPAALRGSRQRKVQLLALPESRNRVAHAKDLPTPDFKQHWQAIVTDLHDAFFRYFPAAFRAPSPP